MTTSIGIALVNTFKEPILKVSNDLKTEFLHVFDNGLPEYVTNFYDKYSKTKTFIYRDEKVNFYDIFFPITISNGYEDIDTSIELKNLFKERKYITIIGSAGSGKSMLMKHIFLATVDQSYRIPIVIELRNLTDFNGEIQDYITSILTKNELAVSAKTIDRILKQGKFIFLLDGYDEIYSSAKNRITNDIEEFVDTYNKNIFVISSRPGSNAESLQRFDNFYVESLNLNQIEDFIKLQFRDHDNSDSVNRIVSVIKKEENTDYKDYLSNPLLLSMFIFTFNAYPELPKYKNKFYWNVFDTLCTKHDSLTKKGFWLHERKSNLLNDDLETILKWFSYITLFKGKYNFDENYLKSKLQEIQTKLKLNANTEDIIYDLTVSIAILIQDGTEYTFPHKSLQEYFTSSLIKSLNESQKQKIYFETFIKLEEYSTGGKSNLYKLCYEMDKFYFSKFFLIPRAEKFLRKIDASTNEKIIKSYIKIFSPYFMFMTDNKIGAYSQDMYVQDSYLAFFDISDVLPSFDILNNNINIISEFIKTDKSSKFLKLTSIISKPEFIEFINKTETNKNILKLHDKLVENLESLKKDIEKENDDTQQLLDI